MSTHDIVWNDDYSTGIIATDDPRVFGVLKRDDDASAPDGDAYAPAYFLDGSHDWRYEQAGSTFTDDETIARIIEARNRRVGGNYEGLVRYARIFLGTTFELVSSHVHRDYQVLVLNTPAWREHVGLDHLPYAEQLDCRPDSETWQAYLDGDVWGVGVYVDNARTDHDAPLPDHQDAYQGALDNDDEWMVWGYYGETYAAEEAYSIASNHQPAQPLLF